MTPFPTPAKSSFSEKRLLLSTSQIEWKANHIIQIHIKQQQQTIHSKNRLYVKYKQIVQKFWHIYRNIVRLKASVVVYITQANNNWEALNRVQTSTKAHYTIFALIQSAPSLASPSMGTGACAPWSLCMQAHREGGSRGKCPGARGS